MIDIQLIRKEPDTVRAAIHKLGVEAPIDRILKLDRDRRELLQQVEGLRQQRNETSEQIGRMVEGADRQASIERMRGVNDQIGELEQRLRWLEAELEAALYQVPNLPHESVPVGAGENENQVLREEGQRREFGFSPLPHWELGPQLGILDFERGVKLSGSRFYILKGAGARLQRALIAWMLDLHVAQHGYTEIYPPALVKEACMWGAGQLPKFAENIYRDAEEDLWLIGTAEIPLTNLHRDEILELDQLPLGYVAYTPCFRREKFSAGRDVRGIKRGHQFDKVEMYKFCRPEDSVEEFEAMVADAEATCQALGLPYRLLLKAAGDMSEAAHIGYDIEVWAAGCGEWLEVSSISRVGDYQARRAAIKYRPKEEKGTRFVHTINGSGLGLPRTLIAVLENNQQADGSVRIPEVLLPWMGGVDTIAAES